MISKNEIKLLRSLHRKKFRDQQGAFIVEGDKMVQEAIDSELEVTSLYVQSISSLHRGENVVEVSEREMGMISMLHTPSPSLAVVKMKSDALNLELISNSQVLVLDSIRDPGNLGTILRSANWFGITHVLVSMDTVDCYNSKVVQASMGAVLRVSVWYCDLPESLRFIKAHNPNFALYGAFLEGMPSHELSKLDGAGALVIGSESFGISSEIESLVDKKITIEKKGGGESLNAGVAAAILLHQWC